MSEIVKYFILCAALAQSRDIINVNRPVYDFHINTDL